MGQTDGFKTLFNNRTLFSDKPYKEPWFIKKKKWREERAELLGLWLGRPWLCPRSNSRCLGTSRSWGWSPGCLTRFCGNENEASSVKWQVPVRSWTHDEYLLCPWLGVWVALEPQRGLSFLAAKKTLSSEGEKPTGRRSSVIATGMLALSDCTSDIGKECFWERKVDLVGNSWGAHKKLNSWVSRNY